jgi:hypothetical protein
VDSPVRHSGYANGAGRIASIISPIVVGFLVPMGLTSVFVVLAAGYLLAAIVVLCRGICSKAAQETSLLLACRFRHHLGKTHCHRRRLKSCQHGYARH